MKKSTLGLGMLVIVLIIFGSYFYDKNVKTQQELEDLELQTQEEREALEIQKQEELEALEKKKQAEISELQTILSNNHPSDFIQAISKERPEIEPFIIRQFSLGREDMIQPNDEGITFMKFEVFAVSTDVALQKVVFQDGHGRFLDAGNFALWVDTDSDGTTDSQPVQTIPGVKFNRLVIEGISGTGYVIEKNQSVVFELKADEASFADNPDAFAMKFWDGGNNDYIDAIDLDTNKDLVGIYTDGPEALLSGDDGYCLGLCGIRVYTTYPLKLWTPGS